MLSVRLHFNAKYNETVIEWESLKNTRPEGLSLDIHKKARNAAQGTDLERMSEIPKSSMGLQFNAITSNSPASIKYSTRMKRPFY